jgi:hypothetical protein
MTAHIRSFFIFAALLVGASISAKAACTQTLSPGANIASALSSAPADSTICLNSGNYGSVNLFDIKRTSFVTLQSASAKGAVIAPQVGNSTYIRLSNLTINSGLQNSCSRNIEWTGNTMTGAVTLTNSGCSGSLATVFDGNVFGAMDVGGGYEGRLSLIYGSGITIKNNTFGPGGASDGIFMGGNVSNVMIGPGNKFTGILESQCGTVHCDAVQGYGAGSGIVIQGNLFENGDTFIMMPDGSSGIAVRDNVFNGNGVGYIDKIQFGSANSPVFQHNTLVNVRASFDSKTGSSATSNALVENNIVIGGSSFKTANGSGCSNCTFRSNLYGSTSFATGSTNLIGTPTFVGGSSPTSWAGFALAASSIGKGTASDKLDMGPNFGGATVPTPVVLSPPTNLLVR